MRQDSPHRVAQPQYKRVWSKVRTNQDLDCGRPIDVSCVEVRHASLFATSLEHQRMVRLSRVDAAWHAGSP